MITASDVKALREKTGAGMMDCKNALTQANGDFEEAIKILREKGLASAAKKADRIAAEGVVESFTSDEGGVLVEVNCETDFVAKTPVFVDFVRSIAKHIMENDPSDVVALLEQNAGANTVSTLVKEKIGEIGEKIDIRRFTRFGLSGAGLVDSYIHMGGKIGVLVEIGCESAAAAGNAELKAFAHDVAMQIAAANPLYLNPSDVPEDVIASEKEILRVQALNEGKPEKIVDKMVEGRIQKYYKDFCLIEQVFVKDQNKSIKQLVKEMSGKLGENIEIRRFVRYEMGEGLEKRKDDFAEEVMKQTSK
ncbi:MAG: translation elongation factor Ts [Burkholderiales bacterium]